MQVKGNPQPVASAYAYSFATPAGTMNVTLTPADVNTIEAKAYVELSENPGHGIQSFTAADGKRVFRSHYSADDRKVHPRYMRAAGLRQATTEALQEAFKSAVSEVAIGACLLDESDAIVSTLSILSGIRMFATQKRPLPFCMSVALAFADKGMYAAFGEWLQAKAERMGSNGYNLLSALIYAPIMPAVDDSAHDFVRGAEYIIDRARTLAATDVATAFTYIVPHIDILVRSGEMASAEKLLDEAARVHAQLPDSEALYAEELKFAQLNYIFARRRPLSDELFERVRGYTVGHQITVPRKNEILVTLAMAYAEAGLLIAAENTAIEVLESRNDLESSDIAAMKEIVQLGLVHFPLWQPPLQHPWLRLV